MSLPSATIAAPPEIDRGRRGVDLARALALALLVFAIFFVFYSRSFPPTSDEMIDFGLTQSFAKWQIAAIDQVSTVGPKPEQIGTNGDRYSKFGPLQAVLATPLYWIAELLPIGAVDTVLLLNAIVAALAVAVLFLLARRLGYRPAVALAVAALAAFGTPLWVHAKRFYAEPTITLCVVVAVYCAYAAATTRRPVWIVATGLGFGAAVAAKYVDAALLIPVPLYLAWTAVAPDRRESWRIAWRRLLATVGWFALGAGPICVLLLAYNFARFGNPLASGYAHDETFSNPTWVGVAGFLVSPGKSIFVYTPAFLLLFGWGRAFVRRFPAFAALLGGIVALHLIIMGSWVAWWGAWTWGPRFLVPIMALLALALAEGIATVRRRWELGLAALLATLSVAVQVLGIAVNHDVYIVQLLPLNPLPDTLTIWNVQYSPILHQVPLMTRQYLDFVWIQRSGPAAVNGEALAMALLGATAAAVGCAIIWRSAGRLSIRWRSIPTLAIAALVVATGVYGDLRSYEQSDAPAMRQIARAIATAPRTAGVLQMTPDAVVDYDNWQKRPLPELGWIEEPRASPTITARLERMAGSTTEIWVATRAPAKSADNGVEAYLDRSLVQISAEAIGPFRLLRYATSTGRVSFNPLNRHFAEGIELVGYHILGNATPGQTLNVTLAWRADDTATRRADYTVFVHLLDDSGHLVAQQDDPPASGYLPTSGWAPNQVVYDLHAVAVPASAPTDLHVLEIGLYLPSNGRRLAMLGAGGTAAGDAARVDLRAR